MSSRPFQCTPAAWNRDPILNSISWEAEFLFRRISLECDRYWRMAVDGAAIAHSVRCRALEPSRRYQAWTLPKVARALDELMAAGIVRRLVQAERCWLEVAAWLQYAKGSCGDIVPERAAQVELALPGELFVMDTPPTGVSPPSHCNERTSREEKDKTSRSVTLHPVSPSASKDGTRSLSRDREQELLDSLSVILGPSEMLRNGGMWRERIRHCPKAVRCAIESYKLRVANYHRPIRNKSAWLTDSYERASIEISGSGLLRTNL